MKSKTWPESNTCSVSYTLKQDNAIYILSIHKKLVSVCIAHTSFYKPFMGSVVAQW